MLFSQKKAVPLHGKSKKMAKVEGLKVFCH